MVAIAQGIAALPGFSRSGLTISIGLLCGLDRLSASRYSFLVSIPIILGSSILYPCLKLNLQEILSFNWVSIIIGTIVSGVVGYICIKSFFNILSMKEMKPCCNVRWAVAGECCCQDC